jgi:adenylate kinase family enzyme
VIVNIRGTSGSGKSTIARAVMEHYRQALCTVHPVYETYEVEPEKERKRPLYYLCRDPRAGEPGALPNLTIIGHYQTDCGGTDTINDMEHIFELVREADSLGDNVLFEGLLISADAMRTLQLHNEHRRLHVIALDVDPQLCRESILKRREEKAARTGGKARAEGPNMLKNLLSKHKGTKTAIKKLSDFGVVCSELPRDRAREAVFRLLGLERPAS